MAGDALSLAAYTPLKSPEQPSHVLCAASERSLEFPSPPFPTSPFREIQQV